MASTLRFLRQYVHPRPGVVAVLPTTYDRHREVLAATLFRPAGVERSLPGWVLLHGLTLRGREHPSLVRFASAVAASGAAVLVPDIPEWRELRVAPAVTAATIRSAILALDARGDVTPGRVGLIGFSFGATQGLVAAADPQLRGHLRAVAAWGGYRDVHNLFRFGNTGEYELDGVSYAAEPDPYGRWIMGGNYLTAVPGLEDHRALAAALHRLAREAGRLGVASADPVYDPLKLRLRGELPAAMRRIFDLFAPPAGQPPPDADAARDLARELADAALRTDPLLDPGAALAALDVRTLVAHGRDDRLVPFTESLRLHRSLSDKARDRCIITALFAHSGGTSRQLGPAGLTVEAVRFIRLLDRILDLL